MPNQLIRARIDSILQFMEPYWAWVNCHMVNYLTDQHWQTYVPKPLKEEILSSDIIQECIETVFWPLNDNGMTKFPNFWQFKQTAQQHTLEHFKDIITTKQEFEQQILCLNELRKETYKIKEFLTEKKRHEVDKFQLLLLSNTICNLVFLKPTGRNNCQTNK